MAEIKQYLDYDGLVKFVELVQTTFPTKQITAEALDQINQRLTELIDSYNNHSHTIEEQSLDVLYSNNKLVISSIHIHQSDAPSEEHQVETPLPLPEGLRPNGGGGSTIDYSKEYFTIEALEDGLTTQLSQNSSEYRIDNGEWISLNRKNATPAINSGQKIQFRITNPTISSLYGIGTFTVNKAFNIEGNIMSLLYGDNFEGQIDLSGKNNAFCKLFYNCTTLQNTKNLILPATTLADYCYNYMLYGCTGLTTAPELPATILASSCYDAMFYKCTSLTSAPELPATTLVMGCYGSMFYKCTSLTSTSELPATTLADWCYGSMFAGCTSLTSAPELPATTLVEGCYCNMFDGCSNLNYIKMLATNISARYCLDNWVFGVASMGKFVKASSMTSLPTGTSGIPTGWTVQDYQG